MLIFLTFSSQNPLKTNSQSIGLEMPAQAFKQHQVPPRRPEPEDYDINQFTDNSSSAMNKIDNMMSPQDSNELQVESNFEHRGDDPTDMLQNVHQQPDSAPDDTHRESMQQLDNVLESIAEQ